MEGKPAVKAESDLTYSSSPPPERTRTSPPPPYHPPHPSDPLQTLHSGHVSKLTTRRTTHCITRRTAVPPYHSPCCPPQTRTHRTPTRRRCTRDICPSSGPRSRTGSSDTWCCSGTASCSESSVGGTGWVLCAVTGAGACVVCVCVCVRLICVCVNVCVCAVTVL